MSVPGSPDPPNSVAGGGADPRILRQVSTFAFVGLLATALYLVVANALIFLTDMDARWASMLGYGAGMAVSFLGQSRLTFGVRADRRHLARFLVVSGAGLLISYFSVVFVKEVLGINPAWATLITVAVVPAASFIAMKLWVFATRS